MKKLFLFLAVSIAAATTIVGCSNAAEVLTSSQQSAPIFSQKALNRAELAKQAVFMVLPYTAQRVRSGGTGFLLETKNYGKMIITNKHVCETLDEENTIHVLEQGNAVYAAHQIAKSKLTDLCIIKAPKEVADTRVGLQLADTDIKPNEQVYVYGHPFLRPLTSYMGAYINTSTEPIGFEGVFDPSHVMEIGRLNFMVFPGNSGSPLLNAAGRVVGVIFAMEGGSRNGLFVPLSALRRFIETQE